MAVQHCRLCNREIHDPASPPGFDICSWCAVPLGVIPLPPSQRPPNPCARCTGTVFVRVVPRELSVMSDRDGHVAEMAWPMTLTFVPVSNRGDGTPRAVTPADGRGLLESYVCRSCGFIEWYCSDPHGIPIGPEYMTELVDVGPKTPYR